VEPPASQRPAWDNRKTDTVAMSGIEVDAVLAATESLLCRARAA
jgi:hypothetical protein